MQRRILGFFQEAPNEWVVSLDCGHRRHLRHEPPRETRPELCEPEARQKLLGELIDCGRCQQRLVPDEAEVYKATPVFDESTVPKGLLKDHSLKVGTWGRLIVVSGSVEFHEAGSVTLLTPTQPGVVLPQVVHHLHLIGPVSFKIEFLRRSPQTGTFPCPPG